MNRLEIFGKLIFNKKTYFILLWNRCKVLFACLENGQVTFNLNIDEFFMMKKVYSTLLINENKSILVSQETINKTTYKIFYDICSKNYFWKDTNEKFIDIPDDNIVLNHKYNSRPLVVYLKSKEFPDEYNKNAINLGKQNYYSRPVRIGNIFAILMLSSIIGLNACSNYSIINTTINKENTSASYETSINQDDMDYYSEETKYETNEKPDISTSKEESFNIHEILSILEKNPNIDDDTKNFIYNLDFVFEEYYQYMDMNLVKERLKTLKIVYNSNSSEYDPHGYTNGEYDRIGNAITIYDAEKFDVNNKLISILLHEFFHVLQKDVGFAGELSNELFKDEILTRLISTGILDKFDIDSLNSDSGYDTVLYLYKYIALIIPRETLAKYQFQGDESILQQALIHIDKEETDEISANKRAFKLFSDLALATINRDNENLTESIIEEISYYYKQVTGMKIQEDLNTFFQHIPAFMSAESPVGKFLLNAVGIKDTYDLYFNTTEQMSFFQDNTNDTNNKSISFDIVEKDHTIKSFIVPVTSTLCEEYRQFIQRENGRDR